MPTSLPSGFGDATKEGASGGSYVEIRGIFEASIFNLKRESHKRKGADVYYYSVDFRINEGEFDGEDIKGEYVGLYADAIFNLHDILVALGELDDYYKRSEDGKSGQWVALPEEDDLRGKKLYIQVDNAPWQSTDRETKVGLVNPDGSPVLRDGNGISAYFPISAPKPEYRPRRLRVQMAKLQPSNAGGQVPQVPGGFPGQVGAGAVAGSPWGAPANGAPAAGGQAAQQPGTSTW